MNFFSRPIFSSMSDEIQTNDTESNFIAINYSISWIPFVTMAVALITFLYTFVDFIYRNGFVIDSLPTLSEASSTYPISKIFAVGISCFAVLFYFSGTFFIDFLSFHNYSKSQFMRIYLPIISIFFIIMSCVKKNEQLNIHKCFLSLSFLTIFIFGIWSFLALKKISMLRYTKLRLILLILGTICSILLSIFVMFTESKTISTLEAVVEYIMIICLVLYYGLWSFDIPLHIEFLIAKTYINET